MGMFIFSCRKIKRHCVLSTIINKKLILTEAKLLEGKFPRPVFDVQARAYEISRVNFVRMVEGIIPTKGTFDACSISVYY